MKNLISILVLTAVMALSSNAQTVGRKPTPPPQVSVAWDASPDPTVTSYNIYIGTASGSYTKVQSVLATAALISTFTGLTQGTTYFLAATSVTAAGLESEYSNEVVWKAYSLPAPPVLHITPNPSGIQLSATQATPGAAYVIDATQDLVHWNDLAALVADARGEFSFLDIDKLPNRFYIARSL